MMIDQLIKRFREISSVENIRARFVKWLKEIKDEDKELVGNKAYYQSILLKKQFLVPNGFVLLPSAFIYFLKQNAIYDEVLKLLELLQNDPERLEETANKIQKLIYYNHFPPSLKSEILENYHYLGFRDLSAESLLKEQKVDAVIRPSLNIRIEKPFHLTFLKVKEEDLLYAIKTIWAAMFLKANLLKYLNNVNVLFNVPILIEEMIEHNRAGIVEVSNGIATIFAAKGYGVYFSSDAKPDVYKIRLSDYKILDLIINDQSFYYTFDPLENKIVKVNASIKDQIFTDHEIRDIAYFIKKICLEMKTYAKVEFVVSEEKIFITNFYPSLEPFDESKLTKVETKYEDDIETKKLEDKLIEPTIKEIANKNIINNDTENIKIKEVEDVDFLYETYISENSENEKNENQEQTSSVLSRIKTVSEKVGLKQIFLKLYNKLQDKIELSDLKPLVENIEKADSSEILDALNKIVERME